MTAMGPFRSWTTLESRLPIVVRRSSRSRFTRARKSWMAVQKLAAMMRKSSRSSSANGRPSVLLQRAMAPIGAPSSSRSGTALTDHISPSAAVASSSTLGGRCALSAELLVEHVHDAHGWPQLILHRRGEDRLRAVAGQLVRRWGEALVAVGVAPANPLARAGRDASDAFADLHANRANGV